jgi:hypothetical protein
MTIAKNMYPYGPLIHNTINSLIMMNYRCVCDFHVIFHTHNYNGSFVTTIRLKMYFKSGHSSAFYKKSCSIMIYIFFENVLPFDILDHFFKLP